MTTTKTLIEAATLMDEEMRAALGTWPPGRKTSQPDHALVADAARDKALWAVVDWLGEERLRLSKVTGYFPGMSKARRLLDEQLTEAGIERPKKLA